MTERGSRVLLVRCACGWEISGPEDVVVEGTQEHGRRAHNMVATREQVLAMAEAQAEGHSPPSP